jgi:hypothetical protein
MTMARIRIPKNAGKFKVIVTGTGASCAVASDKSGGNRIIIPCKSFEQANELCEKLNRKDHPKEIRI